jgi:phosphoribosylformylglycinamidine synthase
MNAMVLISNASRKLICNGIIPECGTGYISINESNNSIKNSFLKGMRSAVKHLNINMDHFAFIPSKSSLLGSFYVLGKKVINKHIDKEFNHSDHFISILGTHTGELGGSKYLSICNNEDLASRPTVDLLTEQRLQNLIISAFQRNLIQTACPVGEGGLAPTLVRLLSKSKNLGARISFSSKLSTPQILFGETQNIAIVSIKEANIMNLERLCMSSGIPNTTIGRVTNDGIFSFNENIKIKVKDLFK